MAKRKNPAAVELGRKGGSVSGVKKGFAALTPEQIRAIRGNGRAVTCTCGKCPLCKRRVTTRKWRARKKRGE